LYQKKKNDFLNIKIKDEESLIGFKKIKDVDKMGTVASFYLINSICKNIKRGSYLNIGVWRGFSLFSGMINTNCEVIGVDNFDEFEGLAAKEEFLKKFNKLKNENHKFCEMDALEFLKKCNQKFDFYFYDALHTYEYQYESLDRADRLLKKGSLILIDDICWNYTNDPIKATQDFLEKNKDKYKLLLDVRTKYNMHPTFWNGYFLIEKIV